MDFDWDNISVGEPGLNTSGSFFFRNVKMENPDDEEDDAVVSCPDSRTVVPPPSESGPSSGKSRQKLDQAKIQQQEACDRAYKYAQVYEKHRKALREKEERQLQEMKKFQARPVPSFVKKDAQKEPGQVYGKKENVEPKFTIPVTPKQMKPERLRKAADQSKKLQDRTKPAEPAKFRAHEARVLKEAPFQPVLAKTVVRPDPFNLRMSARLAERRQYDEQLQKAKEEKARREAEERRLAEERELKLLRKQKEFKANPNPFK